MWKCSVATSWRASRARFAILTRNPRYSNIAARKIRWLVSASTYRMRGESLVILSSRVTKQALYRGLPNHQDTFTEGNEYVLVQKIRLLFWSCVLCEVAWIEVESHHPVTAIR